jgi:hypothetical protein
MNITPKKTINLYGNNIYAYVTYLYGDKENLDMNIGSAIVFAQSLINTGSKADRVIMITDDIEVEYIELLKKFYNHIIKIGYIKIKSSTLFTKYNALNLTNYKKIILIDVNFVILQNPDYLFTLNTPAGYCKENIKTGDIIKNISKNYIDTKILLLEPKLNEFDSIILDITNGINKIKVQNEYINLDAEYMYNRYDNWKMIGKEFLYSEYKLLKYEDINFIYYETSPYKINIVDIEKNDINHVWYKIFEDTLKSHPEIIENKLLKHYKSQLSLILKNKNISRETITDEFDIINLKNIYETDIIHQIHSSLLHKDKFTMAQLNNVEQLFVDINEYEYMKPIHKLAEYFDKNIYLDNLTKYTTSEPIALHKYNYIKISERDVIMNYYMKCRKNMRIIITNVNEYVKTLEDNIKISYIKNIFFTKDEYKSLLFFLNKNNYTEFINNINDINSINYKNISDNNELCFIFYESNLNKFEIKDIIHHTQNFIETIELGEMILNENSIKLIKQMKLNDFTSSFMGRTNLFIQTMRIWQNQNLSLLEKERLLLTGDIYYSTFGLKSTNNINGIFISRNSSLDETEYEKYLEKIIMSDLTDSNSKIFFMNITKENSKSYNKINKYCIDKLISNGKISNSLDLIFDPKNYYYYCGLKIVDIEINLEFENFYTKKDVLVADYIVLNIINKSLISRFVSYIYNEKTKVGMLKIDNKQIKFNKKEIEKIKLIAKKSYIKKYLNLI